MENKHKKSESCWFCDNLVFEDNDKKVKSHCHLTGEKRQAARAPCNLIAKQQGLSTVPLTMHKITKCDSRLFFLELVNKEDLSVPIKLFQEIDERYTYLTYRRLQFINFHVFWIWVVKELVKPLIKMRRSYRKKSFLAKTFFEKNGTFLMKFEPFMWKLQKIQRIFRTVNIRQKSKFFFLI